MTDFLRSIVQTVHNANGANGATAATSPVKTEVRPVDQIQVPPSACAADATASLLALEKQPCRIKVELPERAAFATTSTAATNIALATDPSKAQRAARRDVVNARRETKRKSMSPSCSDSDDASEPIEPMAAMTAAALDKSKKIKTSKTTSALPQSPMSSPVSSGSASTSSSSLLTSAMLFGGEIDALGEERLRAMEAQLESLDPDSKEAKKKRRLIRNRMSAQLHRERKKAYVGQLEDQLLAKEREVQALHDKLAALANETMQMKQQLAQTTPVAAVAPVAATAAPVPVLATVATESVAPVVVKPVAPTVATTPTPAATIVAIEDDVVIKAEPVVDVASAFDTSAALPTATPTATATNKDNWDYCFPSLDVDDDTEMADVAAADLLRDFDDPFAAFATAAADQQDTTSSLPHHHPHHTHHEIHAAKKNIVMVMGMMFSATFFGHSPFFFDVQRGSTFSSYFEANPPNEVAQLNVASKIMSSLEKSSWKDFRDIASWTSAAAAIDADDVTTDDDDANSSGVRAAASPSAASDVTDSSDTCDSPSTHQQSSQIDDDNDDTTCLGSLSGLETDLIDEFVYPVDDPFAPALADTNWFGTDADDFGQSDVDDADDDVVLAVAESKPTASITSRLFEKLTELWHEKNQVLLTVLDSKNEVTRRSVADMSAIRSSMANGSMFAAPPATVAAAKTSRLATDESVSFLYPLSAFSPAEESAPDVMFLEVSCQMSALSI